MPKPADWWYALYDKQRAGLTAEMEDWAAEERLTLAPSDTSLTLVDLVVTPLTGDGGDDPPPVVHLTREGAVWLRDALAAALDRPDTN